jgi:predicted dehydrogenase
MLRVSFVGCGKIADQHAEQIAHLPGCAIVGVCDREELMARQFGERHDVPARFTEVQDLLDKVKPDVVHITTPPQSHYSVGKSCLEAGCHIYVEKPFTITHRDAEDLVRLAEHRNLKLTVGHDAQFSHAANQMRLLVGQGYLGGAPVHMESYYSYDLGNTGYAKSLLGDAYHWVRKLPGGLLQNTISHGISKVAEYMSGDAPEVVAYGFNSELLKSIGETQIVDELRVIIRDAATTAYFTFSSQMRPALHMLRVYGPKNGLIMDERQQTVIRVRGTAYKGFLERLLPPWDYATQYVGNGFRNLRKFIKADFQEEYGKKYLIREFYRAVAEDRPVPIPYHEILRTSRIMDDIFWQLSAARETVDTATPR